MMQAPNMWVCTLRTLYLLAGIYLVVYSSSWCTELSTTRVNMVISVENDGTYVVGVPSIRAQLQGHRHAGHAPLLHSNKTTAVRTPVPVFNYSKPGKRHHAVCLVVLNVAAQSARTDVRITRIATARITRTATAGAAAYHRASGEGEDYSNNNNQRQQQQQQQHSSRHRTAASIILADFPER